MEWIISGLKDSSGNTSHYVALQRDITGQERAQAELHRFDGELRIANERFVVTIEQLEISERKAKEQAHLAALGELTAGIVHDISNSLTPVFGMIQVLHGLDSLPTILHSPCGCQNAQKPFCRSTRGLAMILYHSVPRLRYHCR